MADFDPYHKWLAIPPAEQPPNHYRLLGLAQFEADEDVISAAADRQMAHIRTYQQGAHGDDSQRLLNELAMARVCLLQADTKAQYDAELRRKQSAKASFQGKPLVVAKPLDPAYPPGHGQAQSPAQGVQPHQPQLRTATPLPTAGHQQPQPQPQPRPVPVPVATQQPQGNHPQPLPTPMPAAATAQPQHTPATRSSSDRRRSKKTKAMYWSAFGVFAGGLAGIYIAGIILNVVGVELPPGLRRIPGLGSFREVAENNEANGEVPNERPSITAAARATNPWAQRAPLRPLKLGAGVHDLSCVDVGGRMQLRVRSVSNLPSGSTNITSRDYALSTVVACSEDAVIGFHGPEKNLYVTAKPGGTAKLVMPITAETDCVLEQGNLALAGRFQDADPNSTVETLISRDFDLNQWSKPTNVLTTFGAAAAAGSPGRSAGGAFVCSGEREVFFVATITSGSESTTESVRVDFGPTASNPEGQIGSITVRSTRNASSGGTGAIAGNSSGGGSAESLRVAPYGSLAKTSGRLTTDVATLVQQGRQHVASEDPRDWLTESSKQVSTDMKCALLLVAAEKAVDAGDVVLASTAYERLGRIVTDDFTSAEIAALTRLYQQNKPGFQPTAFAAWSVGVLERRPGTDSAGHRELAKWALQTAKESGDRDLLHRAARVATGTTP